MLFFGNSEQLLLADNVFEENFATSNGGAIWAEGPCIIEGNRFIGNSTERGDGAGLYIVGRSARGVYRNNVFMENEAGDHGGAIYIANNAPGNVPATDIDVHHNVILNNRSWTKEGPDCSGAGIWLYGEAWIHHNTIAFNRVSGVNFPLAGGICLVNTPPGTVVEYNVLYHNNEAGIVAFKFSGPPASVLIRRNVIFGNGPNEVVKKYPEGYELILEENIFEDPMLCTEGSPEVAGISPALNQPYGAIGAVEEAGCGPYIALVPVQKTTWGLLKARYGPELGDGMR